MAPLESYRTFELAGAILWGSIGFPALLLAVPVARRWDRALLVGRWDGQRRRDRAKS